MMIDNICGNVHISMHIPSTPFSTGVECKVNYFCRQLVLDLIPIKILAFLSNESARWNTPVHVSSNFL